jgi:hypothetical protein
MKRPNAVRHAEIARVFAGYGQGGMSGQRVTAGSSPSFARCGGYAVQE